MTVERKEPIRVRLKFAELYKDNASFENITTHFAVNAPRKDEATVRRSYLIFGSPLLPDDRKLRKGKLQKIFEDTGPGGTVAAKDLHCNCFSDSITVVGATIIAPKYEVAHFDRDCRGIFASNGCLSHLSQFQYLL